MSQMTHFLKVRLKVSPQAVEAPCEELKDRRVLYLGSAEPFETMPLHRESLWRTFFVVICVVHSFYLYELFVEFILCGSFESRCLIS